MGGVLDGVVEKKDFVARSGERQRPDAAGDHVELAAEAIRGAASTGTRTANGQMSRLRPSDWHQGP